MIHKQLVRRSQEATATDSGTGGRRIPSAPTAPTARTARTARIVAWSVVGVAVAFNLWVLRGELGSVAAVNDTSVHLAMVRWAAGRLSAGKLVFDGWFPNLQLGLAQFHHYQSLPHIVAGSFATIFDAERVVTWSAYLLLAFWPLCIYRTMRLFGFDRAAAAAAAALAPLVTSASGYGYEHFSYVWRGNGIWSQLWGMWTYPLALACSWRAVRRGQGYAVAALAVAATIACHFITGYLCLLALGLWAVIEPRQIARRLGRAIVVGAGAALVAAWVVVPLLLDSRWALRTQYNVGTFWFDSYGGAKVFGWLVTGKVFDGSGQTGGLARIPVMTLLVALGVITCVRRFRTDDKARAVLGLFVFSLVLWCGRDTVGFLIRWLPGNEDLLLHRFVLAVHLSGLMLAGIGAGWLVSTAWGWCRSRRPGIAAPYLGVVFTAVLVLLSAPMWTSIEGLDATGARWIRAQQAVDRRSGASFVRLARRAAAAGDGRVFAGSAANGGNPRVGAVPGFSYLLLAGADGVGFTLRTLSLSADAETLFDPRNPAHYDWFNVRYVITPSDTVPQVEATRVADDGGWSLWRVPTTGYLEVIDALPAVAADRTNLLARTREAFQGLTAGTSAAPLVAFDGMQVPFVGSPGTGAPGLVRVQYARPDEGLFGGVVATRRPAVVMVKATYDPRMHATVDGRPVRTVMVAPSLIGVPVGPGVHRIEVRYEPFGQYWVLFGIGAATLVALAVVPRRLDARHRRARRTARARVSL